MTFNQTSLAEIRQTPTANQGQGLRNAPRQRTFEEPANTGTRTPGPRSETVRMLESEVRDLRAEVRHWNKAYKEAKSQNAVGSSIPQTSSPRAGLESGYRDVPSNSSMEVEEEEVNNNTPRRKTRNSKRL